jgi:hypothetical protein
VSNWLENQFVATNRSITINGHPMALAHRDAAS